MNFCNNISTVQAGTPMAVMWSGAAMPPQLLIIFI